MICFLGPDKLFQLLMDKQKKEKEEEKSSPSDVSSTTTVKPKEDEQKILGFDPVTGVYDSSNYEHTVLNMPKINSEQLKPSEVNLALAFSKILETKTDFFKKLEHNFVSADGLKEEFSDFISESIAYHSQLCIESGVENDTIPAAKIPAAKIARFHVSIGAVLPTSKLLSHSCDPNIFTWQRPNYKEMAYVAIRDLKSGEEICDSYQKKSFHTTEKSERQSFLLSEFEFTCDCIPCLEDWPTLEKISDEVKFCCSVCSSKLGGDERRRENFQKIILNPGNNFKCSSCGLKHSEEELQEKLVQYRKTLESCLKLFKDGFILEGIKSLKEAGQFFQFNLIPPTKDQIKCEAVLGETISQCVVNE